MYLCQLDLLQRFIRALIKGMACVRTLMTDNWGNLDVACQSSDGGGDNDARLPKTVYHPV